jgi:hypothetical protein
MPSELHLALAGGPLLAEVLVPTHRYTAGPRNGRLRCVPWQSPGQLAKGKPARPNKARFVQPHPVSTDWNRLGVWLALKRPGDLGELDGLVGKLDTPDRASPFVDDTR